LATRGGGGEALTGLGEDEYEVDLARLPRGDRPLRGGERDCGERERNERRGGGDRLRCRGGGEDLRGGVRPRLIGGGDLRL
jgi:hypothetical protein